MSSLKNVQKFRVRYTKIKSKGVRFDTTVVKSESSFAVTEIPIDDTEGKYKIRLIYKQKGGGGSGAGAALTKLSESAQCMYAALAWKNNGKIDNSQMLPVKVSMIQK